MPDEFDILAARFLTTVAGKGLLSDLTPLSKDNLDRLPATRPSNVRKHLTALAPDEASAYTDLLSGEGEQALRRLALSVDNARRKSDRFNALSFHHDLLLTEDMLAQASSPGIALYHAMGLPGNVTDLGCGAGIDSITSATLGFNVIAVEQNPVTLILARANAESAEVSGRITFHQADAADFPVTTDFIFADPARRNDAGIRISRHADLYSPPVDTLIEKIQQVRGGCLKLSPLLPDEYLRSLGGRVVFLSEGRECKEACVWFGEAGKNVSAPLSAHLMEGSIDLIPDEAPGIVRPMGEWIYEPDPAVIRVGGVATVAERLDAGFVSAEDVYLTGDTLRPRTPLARSYRVIESMPFQRKEVAAFVRKAGYGRVIVKKRRARMEPGEVLAQIKASNRGPEPEILLILVREPKGHRAVFCTQSLAESRNAYL